MKPTHDRLPGEAGQGVVRLTCVTWGQGRISGGGCGTLPGRRPPAPWP
jgi:hypothetical protein